MTLISEQASSPPHILGNYPRLELVFVCIEKQPAASSPVLSEDPYERLIRLKQLLDAGVISAEEFEREKREVLER